MIFIRTAAGPNTGIGHVIRMSHLARALSERGASVMMVLTAPYRTIVPYIDDLAVAYLRPNVDETPLSESDDAACTLALLSEHAVDRVVVDSYALGIDWERHIIAAGYRVAAIDDLGVRHHDVDLLVDARWTGHLETPKRYENLVPAGCRRLLGPAYALLHPGYRKPATSHAAKVNILFSLGGGGNLNLLADVIDALLPQMPDDWTLTPVLGPLAFNPDRLLALARKDNRIEPLHTPPSLIDAYRQATLFVGAMGTSLYELAAMGTPALTFSLADNQNNDLADLEEIGHYLHLPQDEFLQSRHTAALILTLTEKIDRVRTLRRQAKVRIDGFGARRVAQALLDQPIDPASSIEPSTTTPALESLVGGLSIRSVKDQDINHYLQSRNLPKNRQNMTITQSIARVEHYRWWFTTRRESFVVEHNGRPLLYIWHQKEVFEDRPYLIGGWFVCDETVGFDIAAITLEWQLEQTAKTHPDATWVAVINKENNYVNLLNRYMGFVPIINDDQAFVAVQHFFGEADVETFNYVQYHPESNDFAMNAASP